MALSNLVSYTISNLSNGVSQQPPALRLTTSCEEMINGWPSVVSGLLKRPGSEHLAAISGGIGDGASGHIINRDNNYQYLVVASQDNIRVFDANTGAEQTVTFPQGKSYLNQATNPTDSFRYLTIGDYTFVLNRDVTVGQWEYGEIGSSGAWSPTGTVLRYEDLPGSPSLGNVYYVSAEDVYYRFETIPAKAAINVWNQTYGPAGTAPVGYTQVASLPKTATAGQKVYVKTTITKTTQVYVPAGNQGRNPGYYENKTEKVDTYSGYTGVVQAGTPSFNTWVRRTLREVWSGVSTNRIDPTNVGTIHVTQSFSNTNYSVYINGVLKANFTTGVGVDAGTAVESTNKIAAELRDDLVANSYSVTRKGSTIIITNLGANDTIYAEAGGGDRAIKHYRNSVQNFADLPPNELQGRIVRVEGDAEAGTDDYYVQFDNSVWVECEAWNTKASFRPETMPWTLIRNADETWTFQTFQWGERLAGDKTSNPDPTFVGNTINDIFAYSNRLGFLTDENVVLSEADHYENFYRTTLATLVDSDRLDYAVLGNSVDILRHAIPFNKDLLLMSDRNQFRFGYNQFLGPKNVQIQYTTSFNVSPRIKPVNMGGSVYFVDDKPTYTFSKLYEYFPREDLAGGDDADDVTSHVPEYLPTGVRFMAASTRMKVAVLGGYNRPNTLFVYKFYWAGDKKIQNAWGTWEFPETDAIQWAGFLDNYLYLVVDRPNGTYIERIKVDEDVFTTIPRFTVYLDRKIDKSLFTSVSYNSTTDKTTFTIPYNIATGVEPEVMSNFTVLDVDGVTDIGTKAFRHTVTRVSPNTFTVDGDITANSTTSTLGIPYTFTYEFSRQYMRQKTRSGETIILNGRLQMRYYSLEYHDTVTFKVTLYREGATEITQQFDGSILGSSSAVAGDASFSTGVFRIPVMGNAADTRVVITNDTPYGHAFGSAEWTALFVPRARPI